MIAEERKTNEPLANFDTDSYDDSVEAPVVENKKDLVKEDDLGNATPKELLLYFADRYKETHGYAYVVEWVKEMAIFKSFKERYGINAGPMIKLLFDKHKGKMNDEQVSATVFSKGSKWMQDILYSELQQSKIKEENKPSSEGLMNADDFLRRFAI